METLQCSKCKDTKPVSEFSVRRGVKRGYNYSCKACVKAYHAAKYLQYKAEGRLHQQRRPETRTIWARHGLTDEQYQALVERAAGLCEVCGKRPWVVIDHDHNCHAGQFGCAACVRGLLCTQCNLLLGNAQDDVEALKRAVEYLNTSLSGGTSADTAVSSTAA